MVRVRPAATRLEMRASLQHSLFLLLLEASLLLGAEARKPADDANFGYPVGGIFRYRDTSQSESLHCAFVSTRFKPPPYKENDSFHEAVFHYANQKCDLGLEKSSNKHVILMLPEDEDPCPFEASISEAVSAHAYSLVVARNFDRKSHLAYFTPKSDVLVPRQDIILAELQLKAVEKFKPKNISDWTSAPANGSTLVGPAAKLYLVHVDMTTSSIVLCILACSTVAVGALWAGSTRKLLFLTLHRRIKPKDEQPLNEDANLDIVPGALTAPSSTSLGLAATTAVATSEQRRKHKKHDQQRQQPQEQQKQYDVVRSYSYHSHQPKPTDDFTSTDEEALNEGGYFDQCPLDCNLVTLFALAIATNLLVMYYFSSKMCE
ncbi:uncharacterized protein LOC142814394 [Rhipicephalus microplus]|uniref:uncharacterized protein LOC142814394 n=1 Tax=Rhipicephalus microplus TaxID=6941 RepID=UPI003F6D2670